MFFFLILLTSDFAIDLERVCSVFKRGMETSAPQMEKTELKRFFQMLKSKRNDQIYKGKL